VREGLEIVIRHVGVGFMANMLLPKVEEEEAG
jgi:hypothetical protein